MQEKRKIASLVFALLVIFFSATYYSTATNMSEGHGFESNRGIQLTSPDDHLTLSFLQQKSFSSGYQGCKNEVSFPGMYAQGKNKTELLLQHVIRKIFVVDPHTYTPCKSVILFPFHEFS